MTTDKKISFIAVSCLIVASTATTLCGLVLSSVLVPVFLIQDQNVYYILGLVSFGIGLCFVVSGIGCFFVGYFLFFATTHTYNI